MINLRLSGAEAVQHRIIMKIVLFCFLVFVYQTVATDPLMHLYGNRNLQVGFGKDCYLFWKGVKGHIKNAEFRCGSSKGDPMWIRKIISGHNKGEYVIGSSSLTLYWLGQKGNTKNGEFRDGQPGDVFWIRKQNDGQFAIGFSNCPLFWRGDSGNVKNAEFRCGSRISDTFWIRGVDCKATDVNIIDKGGPATLDGVQIVGLVSGGSCTNGKSSVQLSNTNSVEETIGIEVLREKEFSWGVSKSIMIGASTTFLGLGVSVSATQTVSSGGSVRFGTKNVKSTSTGSSASAGMSSEFKTPGGAMIVGFVKRYRFDKSKVDAEVTVRCTGHQFKYKTTVALKTKTYGHTSFRLYRGEWKQCNPDRLNCLSNQNFQSFDSIIKVHQTFNRCFPNGNVTVFKR